MLGFLCILVQLLISLLFSPETVIIPRRKVCDFFFCLLNCFMTLLSMTDFLNSKPLAHAIVSWLFFVSSQVFWGCKYFCAGSPFPAYVVVGLLDILRKVPLVANNLKVGFRGTCERLVCRTDKDKIRASRQLKRLE